ncbi:DUF7576 family protein [Natronobacterium haloterrestre]
MPDPDEKPDQTPSDAPLNEGLELCANCGTALSKDEWCPILTDTDADGDLVIRSFCDEGCKEAWSDADSSGSRSA